MISVVSQCFACERWTDCDLLTIPNAYGGMLRLCKPCQYDFADVCEHRPKTLSLCVHCQKPITDKDETTGRKTRRDKKFCSLKCQQRHFKQLKKEGKS